MIYYRIFMIPIKYKQNKGNQHNKRWVSKSIIFSTTYQMIKNHFLVILTMSDMTYFQISIIRE
jgi:hypothetical protein